MSLPFTVASNHTNGLSAAVAYCMTNYINIGDAGLAAFAYADRAYLNFYSINDDNIWSAITNGHLGANDEIYFTITYFTNS